MFEKVSRSLKYDSIFWGPQTYIYIYIYGHQHLSLYPAGLCAQVINIFIKDIFIHDVCYKSSVPRSI